MTRREELATINMKLMLVVVIWMFVSSFSKGFILDGITLLPLPQFANYGKSMVLVGGNLQDNNSEIYNTIVEMAVSEVIVLLNLFI